MRYLVRACETYELLVSGLSATPDPCTNQVQVLGWAPYITLRLCGALHWRVFVYNGFCVVCKNSSTIVDIVTPSVESVVILCFTYQLFSLPAA